MKRSDIKAGEFFAFKGGVDKMMATGAVFDAGYRDPIFDEGACCGLWSVLSYDDVTLTDPPPWFQARWESRDAMIAATTKILATLNFGDVDEAKTDLRNLLEQLKKGAENE